MTRAVEAALVREWYAQLDVSADSGDDLPALLRRLPAEMGWSDMRPASIVVAAADELDARCAGCKARARTHRETGS